MLFLLQPPTATAGFLTMMRTKWPPPPSFVRNLLGGRRHHHCLLHTFVAAPSNARGGSSLLMLLRYDQPNKSATMIHSRRSLRHKMGGSSSSHDDEHDDSKKDDHSSTDSTSSSSEEKKKKYSSKAGGDIKTPDQLFERYKEEMMQYVLENAVKVKGSEKMKWPDIKTPDQLFERYASKMLNEEAEKFVEQFNERYAHTGYKIELADARERKKMFIALVVGLYALVFLAYWFRPKNGILPEHKMIMEQPPITFDQLLDILSAGEVQMLYYYPGRNKVVATLQPGAQINGAPFTGPGLHVSLDDTFRFDPYKFPTRIRATEHQLGIDEREAVPIAMRNTAWLVVLTYLIGCFLLITYASRLGMREIAKRMQRVVPTGGGRTGKPWKHKEISSKEDGPSKE